MVDGQGEKAAAVVSRPVGGDGQQGDGVSSSGQGQGEGPLDVRLKPGGQPFADAVDPGRGGRAQPALRGAGQAKRVRRPAARVRRAALPAAA